MNVPYAPTDLLMTSGMGVLEGALLAEDETSHVATLLKMMNPPQHAVVLDMGCGIGGMARMMSSTRPDLRFVLVNNEPLQLALADPTMLRVLSDYHHVPLPDGFADGAMFCYSLCYARTLDALVSARRLVKRGGFLFVYGFERLGGDNELMESRLGCHALCRDLTETTAANAGWHIGWWRRLTPHPGRFSLMLDVVPDGRRIFADVALCAWRAV